MKTDIFNVEKIIGFCEKVCYFLIMNLLFVAVNLPLLLFFVFVGISQVRTCLPLFLLCLSFLPPSLCALFYGFGRMVEGRERGAIKDFARGYGCDWIQKYQLSLLQMFAIFLFWNNMEFFSRQFPVLPLVIVFGLLFFFSILITPTLYLLISRYEMRNWEALKAAMTIVAAKPVITLGNVAALGIILAALELSAGTIVLFMGSIYGFLIVYMNRSVTRLLDKMKQV